ncbi:hypothetical protein JAAARDRAFT_334505 [Jaapia argillacea MUCL 33604]|uniref:Uncharacterized protein n=1 Tax=Jaapia argillacea MUCL 33604 TaxID=933084 RepID=A0A067PKD4_9AGAM|nr:hypothetical protein JAAARDRAFT_334505 [Jaapia argillacea MUCL 33604]
MWRRWRVMWRRWGMMCHRLILRLRMRKHMMRLYRWRMRFRQFQTPRTHSRTLSIRNLSRPLLLGLRFLRIKLSSSRTEPREGYASTRFM